MEQDTRAEVEPRYVRLLRVFTLVRMAKLARCNGGSPWYVEGLLLDAAQARRAIGS